MKIKIAGVPVPDQALALTFYTEKLGFIVKRDIPLGEHRWLTVVSPEEQSGTELLLEPLGLEETKVYQKTLYDKGIPWTQFNVDDIDKEYERLIDLGVEFSMKPTQMGAAKVAVFDDTCGNRIQLVEEL